MSILTHPPADCPRWTAAELAAKGARWAREGAGAFAVALAEMGAEPAGDFEPTPRDEADRLALVGGAEPVGMAGWIGAQAAAIGSHGSGLALWLAARVAQLAEECRFLGAETPDQFDGRSELWADWVADREADPASLAAAAAEGGAR